jgi:general secretion pathway protein I
LRRSLITAQQQRQSGFTLIEVLVALAIVSIALLAGMRATDSLVNNAQRLSNVLLGQMCAENELIKMRLEVRLAKTMPNVGDSPFSCEQAGHTLTGTRTVTTTPNPSIRRVDALVMDGDALVLKLSTIVGRF